MSLDIFCHKCHLRDFNTTAAIIDPATVGCDLEECPSCNVKLAEIPESMMKDLLVSTSTGSHNCSCGTIMFIISAKMFNCAECQNFYLERCEIMASYYANFGFQIVDIDEIFDTDIGVLNCLNLHRGTKFENTFNELVSEMKTFLFPVDHNEIW
jgi:hypothetical protein